MSEARKYLYAGPLVRYLEEIRVRVAMLKENGAEDSLAVKIYEKAIAEMEAALKLAAEMDEWGDTEQAAEILEVSTRRVVALCKARKLEWQRDGERSPYRISLRSVYMHRAGVAA